MDSLEIIIFLLSGYWTVRFLFKWYNTILRTWPYRYSRADRGILACLPVCSLIIIIYVLKVLASFDVVSAFSYILFYVLIGYAWISYGLTLMAMVFDISWIDDVLSLNNKAAIIPVAGGFLGLTIIYAGANIGDGPGFWCVFFAGGLGVAAWLVIGIITHGCTGVLERITVERDISCGIRFGFFLLASSIILGRASAGDWTSYGATLVEFMDGWPVLCLTVLMIVVERYYISREKDNMEGNQVGLTGSVFWGILYVIIAIGAVTMLPGLPENPHYGSLLTILI